MPHNLSQVLTNPWLLTAGLVIGFLLGLAVENWLMKRQRAAWKQENAWRWKNKEAFGRSQRRGGNEARVQEPGSEKGPIAPPKAVDAADQLRIVMGAEFTIQPLLNKGETRLFKELDRYVLSCNPGWQVMAQVSLGEILRSKDALAYSCINSKRVDLLLVDEDCQPRHVVEYQGSGHHKGTAAARDAIKKEALRRAGIGYHEVVAGQTTPSELRRLVERLVVKPAAVAVAAPLDAESSAGQHQSPACQALDA